MREYKVYHHVPYKRDDEFNCFSQMSVNVLPELVGKPWNEVALGYVHGLRPSAIRVSEGELTCDAVQNRVTVIVDKENVIKEITQEVEVGLPKGVAHGSALRVALEKGIDSEECQWHNDDRIVGYIYAFGDYRKSLKDGTSVPYPKSK